MIAKLVGILDAIESDHLVVDVGGVGYLVFCSARMLRNLPPQGARIAFPVETVVREDHIHLYGFEDADERRWFRLLQTVQGVGAKVALALLGTMRPEEIAGAIAAKDVSQLTRAPGIGRRLAERVVGELKDKVPAEAAFASVAARSGARALANRTERDAISALVHLGYRQNEAQTAVGRAVSSLGLEAPVEALIRAGLKELAP